MIQNGRSFAVNWIWKNEKDSALKIYFLYRQKRCWKMENLHLNVGGKNLNLIQCIEWNGSLRSNFPF